MHGKTLSSLFIKTSKNIYIILKTKMIIKYTLFFSLITQVTSPGGNETRSARLSVIELPYAPNNVKAERYDTVMQRSINVSWAAGFDGNSPILKFIIQRREVPELGI